MKSSFSCIKRTFDLCTCIIFLGPPLESDTLSLCGLEKWMFTLLVLEAQNLRCLQRHAHSGRAREGLLQSLSQLLEETWLMVTGLYCHVHVCLSLHIVLLCSCFGMKSHAPQAAVILLCRWDWFRTPSWSFCLHLLSVGITDTCLYSSHAISLMAVPWMRRSTHLTSS